MPEASANTIPTPPPSEAASREALIKQIATEARTSGKSITYDPDAPPDTEGDDAPPAPKGKAGKVAAANDVEGNTESDPDDETATTDEDSPEEDAQRTEDQEPAAAEAGEIDLAAVQLALDAEGGVDMLALAKALGREPEQIGLTPGAAKFLRLEKKKSDATLKRAQDLALQLRRDYGDQSEARKAASEGRLEPAIEFIQNTFGMEWNELNKAVAALLQGKPIPGLEDKRKLRELQAEKNAREAEAKKQAETQASQQKITEAKTWIKAQIKGDKLASAELDQQLRDAGFPSVVDLVFDEMAANYSKGLTDPKKALEKVRQKLEKQAKALRTAGLVPAAKPAKTAPVSASKPRAGAQTGAAGNGRPMTDAELRQAVLKEAGLWR
jgi:hypothetical protein